MRRALLVLAAILLAATLPADAAPAATKAKAKVKCHWVKATKKRKRHKVCVKVKAKTPATKTSGTKTTGTPTKPSAPTATAPGSSSTPSAPTASAPAGPAAPPLAADPTVPDPAAPAPTAARLQATTREWSITLSRPALPAGAAILQLVNRGEDAHDLHLRPVSGGADLLAIASTESGGVADASGTVAPGSYTLYCSLPGHEAAGMKATLTVQ